MKNDLRIFISCDRLWSHLQAFCLIY